MSADMKGRVVLLMAPSGSGKRTLVEKILDHEHIHFLKTYTSRPPREGALENPQYEFISVTEFEAMIKAGELIEWANYGDNYYGTSRTELLTALSKKQLVFKEMELQGIAQVRAHIPPEHLTIIYIDAGSWEELEGRIRARAPISESELEKRKERYAEESRAKGQADIIIKNGTGRLTEAQAEFTATIETLITELDT